MPATFPTIPPSTPLTVPLVAKLVGAAAALALTAGTAVAITSASTSTSESATDPAAPAAQPVETPAPASTDADAGADADASEPLPDQVARNTETPDQQTDDETDGPDGASAPEGDDEEQPGTYVPPAPSGAANPSVGETPDAPTPLDPVEPPAATPCDEVTDPDQDFAIARDIVLERDVFSGSMDIVNCGDLFVEVGVKTVPSVTLSTDTVSLATGATRTVDFDIDADAWGNGSIDFKIQVQQGDCCSDRTSVHGFKGDLVNDFGAATDFAPNPGAGGCNTHCISSALLTPRTLTTDLDIAVVTDTPAQIDVFVSERAPVPNQAGDPAFPGLAPSASSDGLRTELDATLTGMEAATDHHLIVRATDEYGHSTIEYHSFRSVTPVTKDGGHLAPTPGCATGCIQVAEVTAAGHSAARITATTSQPAAFDVWLGTKPLEYDDGVPSITGYSIHVVSDGPTDSWETLVDDLDADTTYSVVLMATDEHGGRQRTAGVFTTDPPPPPTVYEVTAHVERIDITHQGEALKRDAGEITLAWAYGNQLVGTFPEQKMDRGESQWIDGFNVIRRTLTGDETFGGINVVVGERDAKGLGFCEAPLVGLECAGIKWEYQDVPALTADDVFHLPQCWTLGYPADHPGANGRCLHVSTPSAQYRLPGFDTVIRYTVGFAD